MYSLTIIKVQGNIFLIQGSTTSHDDLQQAVDAITKETGYIDILVNNAGMVSLESVTGCCDLSSTVDRCCAYSCVDYIR